MRNQRRCLEVAPRAGFEPATIRLTVECSTAELPRNRRSNCSRAGAYNKAFRACKGPNHRLQDPAVRGGKSLPFNTTVCPRFLGWRRTQSATCRRNPAIPSRHDPVAKSTYSAGRLAWLGIMERIRCQPLRPTC